MKNCPRKKTGMSLVEIIIASAIILLLSVILVSINIVYFKTFNANLKSIKATYLIEEGVEAVNFIKNNDWDSYKLVGVDYYLVWTGTGWTATTTKNDTDQIYERKFFFADVNRDINDDIVLSGGSLDPETQKLTVQVSWNNASDIITKSISSYVMKSND